MKGQLRSFPPVKYPTVQEDAARQNAPLLRMGSPNAAKSGYQSLKRQEGGIALLLIIGQLLPLFLFAWIWQDKELNRAE